MRAVSCDSSKSGQPLAPDRYTLTVVGGHEGIIDPFGRSLDADGDGMPGGDYVSQFTIFASMARTVHVHDVVRGPDQPVDISDTGGIPILLDDAEGVTSFEFTVEFDPSLLDVTGANLGVGLPDDWTMTPDLGTPGQLLVQASGETPLSSDTTTLVVVSAAVPPTAPSGASHVLDVSGITLNDGLLFAQADAGLHQVAYVGDATASGEYSGLDASFIARVAVGLDSGFDRFPATDPWLVGDVTRNGTLSGLDASWVARKAVGLEQTEIPDLPAEPPPAIAKSTPDVTFWPGHFVAKSLHATPTEQESTTSDTATSAEIASKRTTLKEELHAEEIHAIRAELFAAWGSDGLDDHTPESVDVDDVDPCALEQCEDDLEDTLWMRVRLLR